MKATTKRAQANGIGEPTALLDKRRKRFGSDGFGGVNSAPQLAGDAAWQAATEAEEARQMALETSQSAGARAPQPDEDEPTSQPDEAAPLPPPAAQSAPRPPAQLNSANLQAAVKIGMKSAGLSWLQMASSVDAAVSTAVAAGISSLTQNGLASGFAEVLKLQQKSFVLFISRGLSKRPWSLFRRHFQGFYVISVPKISRKGWRKPRTNFSNFFTIWRLEWQVKS